MQAPVPEPDINIPPRIPQPESWAAARSSRSSAWGCAGRTGCEELRSSRGHCFWKGGTMLPAGRYRVWSIATSWADGFQLLKSPTLPCRLCPSLPQPISSSGVGCSGNTPCPDKPMTCPCVSLACPMHAPQLLLLHAPLWYPPQSK